MSRLTKQLFAPLRMLFCSSLFSSPDHRLGMSLPARAGLFTLLCLLGVTVGMLIAEVGLASIGGFIKSHLMSSWIVALVLVAAPVAVMLVASRFVTRVDCEFRDIEDAWQEGMRVLRVRGISLSETPLFLVVGPRDAEEARAVVEASDIKFDVKGLPFGESPLIWFASQDAIFLACPGASQVSLLTNSVLGHSVDSDNPLSTITEKSLFRQTVGAVMDFIAASSELEAPKSSFGFVRNLTPAIPARVSHCTIFPIPVHTCWHPGQPRRCPPDLDRNSG